MQNRLVLHPRVAMDHQEGGCGHIVPPEGKRGPSPTQGLPSPGPSPGKRSPTKSDRKNQWEFWAPG